MILRGIRNALVERQSVYYARRYSSNEIENPRMKIGKRAPARRRREQGKKGDAVISRLEEPNWFLPAVKRGGTQVGSVASKAREKENVWIQHFNKSHPRFCRRSATMNFPSLNWWSTTPTIHPCREDGYATWTPYLVDDRQACEWFSTPQEFFVAILISLRRRARIVPKV